MSCIPTHTQTPEDMRYWVHAMTYTYITEYLTDMSCIPTHTQTPEDMRYWVHAMAFTYITEYLTDMSCIPTHTQTPEDMRYWVHALRYIKAYWAKMEVRETVLSEEQERLILERILSEEEEEERDVSHVTRQYESCDSPVWSHVTCQYRVM